MESALTQPWPWYVAGPLIGLMVPALLLFTGEMFGLSSSFRHLNALCSPRTRLEYLKSDDWRREAWNLFLVAGILVGSFLATHFLAADVPLLPDESRTGTGLLSLFVGGVLVGFGTRYASGCTSSHSISGLATLNWPSLVATCCFFAGGLAVVWPAIWLGQ
ncbi:MAG: YeeE/YedE family protein [Candidatus Latescibacteria bacterium]|nr:YeeE/YedE family protein [Candidatus Latescibacterota bacterium]